MNDDLATAKEKLADALSVVDRFVQILERQLGKGAPRVIEAREKLCKLTQLATGRAAGKVLVTHTESGNITQIIGHNFVRNFLSFYRGYSRLLSTTSRRILTHHLVVPAGIR